MSAVGWVGRGGPLGDVRRATGRLAAAAQNALEVARFGGLDTGEKPSPYRVVAEDRVYRLRRYLPDRPTEAGSRPLILVPPLMLACEVYDVSPSTSAVDQLSASGREVYVVDFGAPEREEGGLDRTLSDHVLAVSAAVDHVVASSGGPVHLGGYSQGGMFCYQAAAYRQSAGIASIVTFGSPVDTWAAIPFGVPEEVVVAVLGAVVRPLPHGITVPGWLSRTAFSLLDPAKSLRSRWDFVRQLGDRDALTAREGQRRFLEVDGWVAWPGPALADLLRDFITQNRMLSGGFVIGEHTVTLADITSPILCFVGSTDQIGTPSSVRAVRSAAPRAHSYEIVNRVGHFGLVVGSAAVRETWPEVSAWMAWQDKLGARPERIRAVPQTSPSAPSDGLVNQSAHLAQLAAGVGVGVARSAAEAGAAGGRLARQAVGNVVEQLPRLTRLDRIDPESHISVGLLLAEQAEHHPDETCFLFEDRAYSYAEADRRIEAVVRGLIAIGTHQGERVGVLMATRPSALAVVAALSRLGAVAVMLRPDGAPAEEAELGAITRLIVDPEHVDDGRHATSAPIHVLGGVGPRAAAAAPAPPPARDLGPGVEDLEAVDPAQVALPGWYHPNGAQGRDLAFVLFSGEGPSLRASGITNRRWAVSAFGTASAAALGRADTIYSLSAFHHPAGLLTGLGGALASGSRLAMARQFDPTTFWTEVRRYGVTAVTYTWAMVHELLVAPEDPGEQHHPIRLWLGSGMPANLWRQVQDRFAPSRVLELYASTEAEAVLVNVSGRKVGAKGRPLPGSARIRLAAWDPVERRLITDALGFALDCEPGEVGMLLAKPRDPAAGGTVLRGVFDRDDRWVSTGDLFRVDTDGDFWMVDNAARVVIGPDGPAYALPVEDVLASLRSLDLIAAYGASSSAELARPDVLAAAVTLRPGRELTTEAIDGVLDDLPVGGRPAWVCLLTDLPLTAWYRPKKTELGAAGPPRPGHDGVLAVWRLEPATGRYRKLPAPRSREHAV